MTMLYRVVRSSVWEGPHDVILYGGMTWGGAVCTINHVVRDDLHRSHVLEDLCIISNVHMESRKGDSNDCLLQIGQSMNLYNCSFDGSYCNGRSTIVVDRYGTGENGKL
jgi:hypothetical protein